MTFRIAGVQPLSHRPPHGRRKVAEHALRNDA